ncbi:tautomerase-like protein [Sinobaca qinghaiensis]|uniref:Tautomerase-like protein n=1 Tax=Sinobaca qinghaiensis TaxID=342944 RepID=A0A419UX10_9BACL|nr:tautomerase family protein [Sinobaca qinghaiensis]RKD69644.1 tautomerase-like protein [Sinobaca qinghaiensis]
MPLLRFDIIAGRSDQELKELLDTVHQAMVNTFEVPETDRYQIVNQHQAEEMIIEDTGLGFTRTNDVVIISVTSKTRTNEKKQAFYQMAVENLEKECGISPENVMINITENGEADWSFGNGEAQFLTGKL